MALLKEVKHLIYTLNEKILELEKVERTRLQEVQQEHEQLKAIKAVLEAPPENIPVQQAEVEQNNALQPNEDI